MLYKTKGTCARSIDIEIEDGVIKNVRFMGGCHGNAQGLSRLLSGMIVSDVIMRLEGIKCGRKDTSCPDQLARVLREWQGKQKDH